MVNIKDQSDTVTSIENDAEVQEKAAEKKSAQEFDLGQFKSLLESGQLVEMEVRLRQFLESPERSVDNVFQVAELLFDYKKTDLAETAYKAVLRLDAENSSALARLGSIALARNDAVAAANYYRKFIESSPLPDDAVFIGLGNALEQLGDYKEALNNLSKVSDTKPLGVRMARFKQQIGLWDDAIDYFEHLVFNKLTDQDHKLIVDSFLFAQRYGQNRFAQRALYVLSGAAQFRFKCVIDGFGSAREWQGWLSDKLDPEKVLTLELLENNYVIASSQNTQTHQARGPGGFTLTLPIELLDGNAHTFILRVKDYFGYLGAWRIVTPAIALESVEQSEFLEVWQGNPGIKLAEPEFRKEMQIITASKAFLVCDSAFLFNKHTLILTGWVAKHHDQLSQVKLFTSKSIINVDTKNEITHHARPDLLEQYPWSSSDALGYVIVVNNTITYGENDSLSMSVTCNGGQYQRIQISPREVSWAELSEYISQNPVMAKSLFNQLFAKLTKNEHLSLKELKHKLNLSSFSSNYPNAQTMVERPDRGIIAVDRAYPLKKHGILIFGWRLFPKLRPESVTIRSEEGAVFDITHQFFSVMRSDVSAAYRGSFPSITDDCGFVCFSPLETWPGELRALVFDFGELGEVWIKLPTEAREKEGVDLIKEILGMVPSPDKIRNQLFDLFSKGLGKSIETLSDFKKVPDSELTIHQFGTPPEHPETTVIVPLYGRYDFVRYQLSHFADDPDFQNIDLIYVIDDPNIIVQTHELATVYYPVFGVPFRTVSYNRNLGYAGANNVAAGLARGEAVLLLNSDVLPKQSVWVSRLKQSLDSLTDAGAVGPLLQFADDSIQHAGMASKQDPRYPGFLLNSHPNKGQPWGGTDAAYECPMLTAACIMLKKQDYLDLGGLDTGYVIGDFEDSDLCLALRKQGKRLWLVPEIKLWHLERQSQNLESIAGYRQLLTLYNGWRFKKKIWDGQIADPTKFIPLEDK